MTHITGQSLPMEKDPKWNQIQMRAIFLTKNPPKEYIRLWGPCSIMHGQYIQLCYGQLTRFRDSNQGQHGTQRKKQECYYNMQQHTQIQYSFIKSAIWSYMWIQMRYISPCQRQEAAMQVIFISATGPHQVQ